MLDKKYDSKSVEDGKYDKWIKNKYFEAGDTSKDPFTIVIPPPNITGNLHIGHAWDTALQDIIIRYKKMQGFDTLWLPGMDHAAIATESKVVSKLKSEGKRKSDLTRDEFLSECWKWKEDHAENIRRQWAKLGLGLDYSRERFTLDEGLNKAVNHVFVDLYNKGLIYRGEKIINWDPIAKTALSNEEVIYKEEKSYLYYLKYYFDNSEKYILVATTRPETIFGDTAVAVNEKDEKYKNNIGAHVIVPLENRIVPIIGDESVLTDFGTGALKITPAHALEDFEIGQRHNLERINSINPDGTLNEITGKYNKMDILTARKEIIKDLESSGLLDHKEEYTHSVGYSERTDALVEPYLSKQWFVKMDLLSKNLLDIQKTKEKINFVPSRFEKILNHWMENCKDWCISRQLYWGHRIPAWYKGEEIYVGENKPGEGWIQDIDVLDTWFSSALWPFSTLGWPNETEDLKRYFPNDILVTGYDIIFFWVARMAFSSVEQFKQVPFKYCLIHGLIRDKKGRKMSKSLGNGVDPMEMIDIYGSDALRFYLCTSSAPGMDLRFDEEKLKSTWNFINKLWNASRFVLMNLEGFSESDININDLSLEDKWILTKLNNTIKSVTKNMDKFMFHTVGNELYEFIWNVFCDWYIELSKSNIDKTSTKSTLFIVLKSILQMINPFMPYVTDEIYSMMIPDESIIISEYPKYNKELVFNNETALIDEVIENITNIRVFKVENNIPKNSEVELNVPNNIESIIKNMLKISDIKVIGDNTKSLNYKSNLVDITFRFESTDNTEDEKKKLLEEKDTLITSIEKREKLLSNESYTTKAPKNIVDMDREKLTHEKIKLDIILEKLKRIG